MWRSVVKLAGRVFGPDAAFAVAEHHVHDPVQAVFHRPVIADHRTSQARQQDRRGDAEARFALYFSIDQRWLSTMAMP